MLGYQPWRRMKHNLIADQCCNEAEVILLKSFEKIL